MIVHRAVPDIGGWGVKTIRSGGAGDAVISGAASRRRACATGGARGWRGIAICGTASPARGTGIGTACHGVAVPCTRDAQRVRGRDEEHVDEARGMSRIGCGRGRWGVRCARGAKMCNRKMEAEWRRGVLLYMV